MADSSVTHEFDELIESLGKLDTEVVKSSIDVAMNKLQEMLRQSAKFSEYSEGDLQQSIAPLPSKKTADGYVVELVWEEYGTYQDAGVAGVKSGQSLGSELGYGKNFSYSDKMPPPSAFEKFARVNNVSAFVAARSVFMNGLKPTKWASNVLDSNKIDEVLDEVAELIVKLYELE